MLVVQTMTVAIVAARLASTRCPGKVIADVNGKQMIQRLVERLSLAELVDEVVVATGTLEDAAILEKALGCRVVQFGGIVDESDVLGRFVAAVNWHGEVDKIVRVTGDCPLVDPHLVDQAIQVLERADYSSNVLHRSFPRGLDVEVFHSDVLERVHRLATEPRHREHVTLYINENREKFEIEDFWVENEQMDWDMKEEVWCVDYPEDLDLVRGVYEWMDEYCMDGNCGWKMIMEYMDHAGLKPRRHKADTTSTEKEYGE